MKILLRLTGYGWRHKPYLLGAYAATTFATIAAIAIPKLLGTAIDSALESGLQSRLLFFAGLMLLIAVFRGVFGYAQQYLAEAVSQKAAYDLRNDFFRKLQSLSFGFHDQQQTGNLMSRATQDVEAVRRFISMAMIRGANLLLMLIGVSGLMFFTNWRLALVTVAFLPPMLWRATWMAKRLRGIWMTVQSETGHMTTVLQENLAGMRVVKAFGARDLEEKKFEEKASTVADSTYKASAMFATQGSLMTFFFVLSMAAILWFGGREIIDGQLTRGELATFIVYMGMLQMPIRMAGWLINSFSRAQSAGQRLFEILDAESPVEEKADAVPMPRVSGRVKLDQVSLNYDEHGPAITDIDFAVEPGELVAILGAPGSGKSTVVQLIPRFYDVTSGSITIDDMDVRDATLASLRENVGIVLQDIFVFAGTLRDNIAYGLDNAPMEDVIAAAKVAQLHDFIETLPQGYGTWVGERGITLSGGQRQRLAIARTILLDPPILILDDSTSSVDMGTEYMIQQALEDVVKGRTTFVIAHRLSTVRKANLILVLDEGKIVERGAHEDLMQMGGIYRRIYDLQLKPQEEAAVSGEAVPAAGGDA